MFVHGVRKLFPGVPVTEVHPKALLKVVARNSWKAFSNKYHIEARPTVEHVRDAMIAAIAAREGVRGRWPRDLALTRVPEEQDPAAYWLGPVHYYWPE
jgi:predicted nuclease with RNAse H fold